MRRRDPRHDCPYFNPELPIQKTPCCSIGSVGINETGVMVIECDRCLERICLYPIEKNLADRWAREEMDKRGWHNTKTEDLCPACVSAIKRWKKEQEG